MQFPQQQPRYPHPSFVHPNTIFPSGINWIPQQPQMKPPARGGPQHGNFTGPHHPGQHGPNMPASQDNLLIVQQSQFDSSNLTMTQGDNLDTNFSGLSLSGFTQPSQEANNYDFT